MGVAVTIADMLSYYKFEINFFAGCEKNRKFPRPVPEAVCTSSRIWIL